MLILGVMGRGRGRGRNRVTFRAFWVGAWAHKGVFLRCSWLVGDVDQWVGVDSFKVGR